MRMRKRYGGVMTKNIYARVPDKDHDYVIRRAARTGVSMAEFIRQLIEVDRRLMDATSVNVPADNSEITKDNGA
jgi:hypothetical protein